MATMMNREKKKKKQVIFQLSKQVNPTFAEVWYSKVPYIVLKGGRNSFKSSVISLWLVIEMLKYIRSGDVANVIVIRKVANTIRDSVFLKIQWALGKLGIMDQFQTRVGPFKIIHKKTGATFHFYGQDDFAKLKSNDIGNIIAVWYEESAEFPSAEEFDQTNATFSRQVHPKADFVRFFWSFNPPRNPYSWINEWVEDLKDEPNYLVHSSSYKDDKLGFVTPQMFEEIDRIRRNDYDYYRYLYLGEPVGLGTNVYNFDLFKKIQSLPDGEFVQTLSYGLDTGHQQSATVCHCIGLTNKGNVVVLDTYYYSPKNKHRKLAPDELSRKINDFVVRTSQEWNRPVYKYTIDSAEGAIRNQYYKDYNVRWNPVNKGKKVDMIDNVVVLSAQGRIYYLDKEANKMFEYEHKNYRWDEKTIQSDNPRVIEEDDHSPDAFMYYVNDNKRELDLVW